MPLGMTERCRFAPYAPSPYCYIDLAGEELGTLNIAVGRGLMKIHPFFPNSGHFPLEKIKIQCEFLARKGSRDAFLSLCSQYVFR